MENRWLSSDITGVLYLEMILLYLDVPTLFICRNEIGRRFLTLCLDEEDGCYIMAEVTEQDVISMLEQRSTMEEVFRSSKSGNIYMTEYDEQSRKFNVREIPAAEVAAEDLPEQGIYFTVRNTKLDKYLKELKRDRITFFEKCTSEKMIYRHSNVKDARAYRLAEEDGKAFHKVITDVSIKEDGFELMKYLIA